ncbi:hypothetical protein Ade02nite_48020 [Paractinoplanes deccanensis]|uniref:DUF2993 domain-containing protein n=1 Tax=Paractinoplanes deccanensis TaxID=113561 RepID=A0ABQ3Y839_9ACTN|nr:hypothetical protein Ade02nite_48020 [Actinoplanes deccanensis]
MIIGSVAVAALAVPLAADRVAESVAEHRIAARLTCAAGLSGTPKVELGGFPAITQLASGRITSLRIEAVIPYSKVSGTAGSAATGAGSGTNIRIVGGDDAGRLVAETSLSVRGLQLDATVYATLALSGSRLTITPAEVELSGLGLRVPASRLPANASKARTVDLPALPSGLAYREISAAQDGLKVVAEGRDLDLRDAGKTTKSKTCGGTE